LFLILFRLLRRALTYLFGNKSDTVFNNQPRKQKSKFEDAEEANYIDIKPEDEKKN
jgi:hypothetical protein